MYINNKNTMQGGWMGPVVLIGGLFVTDAGWLHTKKKK